MRHVKLFEEFNEEGNHPINDTSASKMYIYYVNNKDPKKFHADVRDPDGKIVFEVNAAHLSNDFKYLTESTERKNHGKNYRY